MAMADDSRISDLRRFYELLDMLEARCGGAKFLRDCSGRQLWPHRGVYFFYENGEYRTDTGTGPRVVRVGTHALTEKSRTTLWGRLSQHKGEARTGSGNRRGSIFRLLIGQALIRKRKYEYPTWGRGQNAPSDVRGAEKKLEQEVSDFIRQMPFLWLAVEDDPGPDSERGYIERNAIALLSNYGKPILDQPSSGWLGLSSDRQRVRNSGLWNQNHVEEFYDPAFLDAMEHLISRTMKAA
jgi:hypothetical protein